MNQVEKTPTSDSYQDYLISRLKNPAYAALYLEAHLEEVEDIEPELLRLALENVLQALSPSCMTSEQVTLHCKKVDEILTQPGSLSVYGLARWLKDLGLKLTVTTIDNLSETE